MARRETADVLRKARKVLETAELGLADLSGGDPRRRISGWHNVVSFGRAVTFVLQNLRTVDEAAFDIWYGPRQEEMKADALFAFFVSARNALEKEGGAETHQSLYIEHLFTDDLAPILANPPPGATGGFFIGDQSGGSGWTVALEDGSTMPYYVELPPTVRMLASMRVSNPPTHHLGAPIADQSAAGLSRLYLAYLRRLVGDAEAHFAK